MRLVGWDGALFTTCVCHKAMNVMICLTLICFPVGLGTLKRGRKYCAFT